MSSNLHPPYDCENCGIGHFAWSLHHAHRIRLWQIWKFRRWFSFFVVFKIKKYRNGTR